MKVQYLLTLPQIRAISLLANIDGIFLSEEVNDRRIVEYDITLDQNFMLDSLLNQRGSIVKDKPQWPSQGDNYYYIDNDGEILKSHWDIINGTPSSLDAHRCIIPMNMRDGSLLCAGKGNPDWNYSAPHGAGRLMSRSEAMRKISIDEFESSMQGIYSTSVTELTIDESPMVYKPIDEIMHNIQDTVEVVDIWKPVYNFKAH